MTRKNKSPDLQPKKRNMMYVHTTQINISVQIVGNITKIQINEKINPTDLKK